MQNEDEQQSKRMPLDYQATEDKRHLSAVSGCAIISGIVGGIAWFGIAAVFALVELIMGHRTPATVTGVPVPLADRWWDACFILLLGMPGLVLAMGLYLRIPKGGK